MRPTTLSLIRSALKDNTHIHRIIIVHTQLCVLSKQLHRKQTDKIYLNIYTHTYIHTYLLFAFVALTLAVRSALLLSAVRDCNLNCICIPVYYWKLLLLVLAVGHHKLEECSFLFSFFFYYFAYLFFVLIFFFSAGSYYFAWLNFMRWWLNYSAFITFP